MKIRRMALVLSLSALALTAAVSGCSPAPVVVADPVEDVTTPVSEPAELLPAPTDETSSEATAPAPEPTGEPAVSKPADDDEADVTADWPVFHDEDYGFQLAYPPEWGHMDLPVYDPGTNGPPTVIKRFVILYPQEWEERLTPGGEPDPTVSSYPALTIEITEGTLEEYRREYMELESSETLDINGIPVLYERDTRDDYNMARYVFQHPTDDRLRVTLSDAISGFSERAEANGNLLPLISVIVSTFTFTE